MASPTITTPINRTITFVDPASPPSSHESYIMTSVSPALINSEIMDTAFVNVVSPESYPGGLEALMSVHPFGDAVPLGEHWSYKYLVDIDGMSYSGRFMAFLESGSVPVKATVYEEYWRDWIEPWFVSLPLFLTGL